MTDDTKHDFNDGRGPVPAHRHPNGGGWVADSATVAESAYVGEFAQVSGNARVYGNDIWTFSNIGSRRATLTICRAKDGWQAATGCWRGSLDALEKAVVATHGEHSMFGQQYAAALDFADRLIALYEKEKK